MRASEFWVCCAATWACLSGCSAPNPLFDADDTTAGVAPQTGDGAVGQGITKGAATVGTTGPTGPTMASSEGPSGSGDSTGSSDTSDSTGVAASPTSTGADGASTAAASSTSSGFGSTTASDDPGRLVVQCRDDADCSGDYVCCTASQCLGWCMRGCDAAPDCAIDDDLVCRHEYWFPACEANEDCTELLGPGFQCQHPCPEDGPLHCQPI